MNTQIYTEASDWLVKNREGELDTQDRKRFDAWLRESPLHVRAYLEMSAVWEDITTLDPSANATADELVSRAHEEGNVLSLEAPHPVDRGPQDANHTADTATRHQRTTRLLAHAAAILALVVACAWFFGQRGTYSTGIGEQRTLALDDTSTIELNSHSRVRVSYSATERDVELLEGQALFRVAKNPGRPFIVRSGTTRVRAVGTAFDVYRKISGSVVTVVEGSVAILTDEAGSRPASEAEPASAAPSSHSTPPIYVAAGEQLTAGATKPQHANVAAATAWTQHSLLFDSAPLSEVAEEFNRYNTVQLVITDPTLASFRINGVFSSADPKLLLKFLRAQPELAVQESGHEVRISRK